MCFFDESTFFFCALACLFFVLLDFLCLAFDVRCQGLTCGFLGTFRSALCQTWHVTLIFSYVTLSRCGHCKEQQGFDLFYLVTS